MIFLLVIMFAFSAIGFAEEIDLKPQTVCPVMGGKIDKDVYVDYKEERIYFCCPSCVESFLKEPEKFEAQEDKKLIHNIKAIDTLFFILPSIVLGVTIFMLFTFDGTTFVQTKAVYNFILIGFLVCGLASVLYRRKIKTVYLYYIININDSIKPCSRKIINSIFAISICFLIISYLLESYRGNWLLWSECLGLIFLMSFNIWRVYKPMFLGMDKNIKPTRFKFPDITSRKNRAIIAILYTVIGFWIFIVGKTLKAINIF